jgi:lipoic acid synthetase
VGPNKIAAIGVRITRGVTMHGIALNINVDPFVYAGIVPCGIQGRGVTSMKLQGVETDLPTVAKRFTATFREVFGYRETDPETQTSKRPAWLKTRLGQGPRFTRTQTIVRSGDLHTVCEEALCPNRGQCWENGRATIMILGQTCSRNCTFCNVENRADRPAEADTHEPGRVAGAIKEMDLNEVVITSVTRDDLPDGGAAIWAETVTRVREAVDGITVEILVPDFQGDTNAIDTVIGAAPDVFAHNLETVPALYPTVRPQANYHRSLAVLKRAADAGLITKTGIMVGLGETRDQVLAVMKDAYNAGARIFTIGQYLQPSQQHHPVVAHIEPADFDTYKEAGLQMGFGVVASAPLVRSSLHSEEQQAYVEQQRTIR